MSEETENNLFETDTRIIENINPSLVVGSNDEEVVDALKGRELTENFSQQIRLNVEEHQTAIGENTKQQSMILNDAVDENDWQANFTNVSIDNSMESVKQDLMALEILRNKTYSEQLLNNKAVIFESVRTDAFGKPKAFAGLKMLQITKDIKTQQPTLALSEPKKYDFKELSKNGGIKKDLKAVVNYDIANEIAQKLLNNFEVKKDLSNDKDLKLLFKLSDNDNSQSNQQELTGREAFLVINSIQRLGHKYLINDKQRTAFFQSIEEDKLALFSKETEVNVKGAIFLSKEHFSMQNVPTTYKGVKLTPLQSFQLAKGNPVSIEGIKDDKIEGIYTATVKLDVLNGKKIEGDRKVSTERLDKGMGENAKIEKVVENNPVISTPKLSQQKRA